MANKNPYQNYQSTSQSEHVEKEQPCAASSSPCEEGVTESLATEAAQESLEEQCRAAICPTCDVKQEADDTRLRALAEMENFKKRLQREHDEQAQYVTEKVLSDLLPALDSLDLAIQYGGREAACKDMLTGITMTRKLLLDSLKPHGLTPVGEVGEPFNPEIHEAMAYEDRDDLQPDHVSSMMQRGYMLKGRLLRPAKVSVSRRPV